MGLTLKEKKKRNHNRKRNQIVKEFKEHFEKLGALTFIDHYALERIADWQVIYQEARDEVIRNGGIQRSSTGYTQINGAQSRMNIAEKNLQNLYSKFGLDIITRDKLRFQLNKDDNGEGLIK